MITFSDRISTATRAIPVWCVYLVLLLPAPVFFWQAATGQMGAEPIEALEREYGEFALRLLIAGLAITPLRRLTRVNLIRFRRAIGLSAFAYVVFHLMVWLFLDVQILSQIWADILKRPFVTVGMTAFLLMIPLALTSNNRSVRALGPRWRSLHKLTYVVALLGCLHFLWLTKGFQLEPLIYFAVVLALLGARVRWPRAIVAQSK